MWDGRQAFLFDLPARKFHLLGLTLWPQDFIYLALLLMMAAFLLFFHYGARGSTLVRLCLPANRLDRGLHLDGAVDRGHALAAHEARQSAMELEQAASQGLEAVSLDNVLTLDRLYIRRLLHADTRAWRRHRRTQCRRLDLILEPVLRLSRPMATRAICASRSASTCARMRASRVRCSTGTR